VLERFIINLLLGYTCQDYCLRGCDAMYVAV